MQTYIVALYTGEVTTRAQYNAVHSNQHHADYRPPADWQEDDQQVWFIPDPAPAWVAQVHPDMRPSPTNAATCCSVKLRLRGVNGDHDEPRRLYPAAENTVVEEAIVCQDLGALTEVELTLEDDPNFGPRDWSARRWKLEKVVITCIQHHAGAAAHLGGDLPKGDHVEKTSTTRDALQWHLHKPQWLGRVPGPRFWKLKADLVTRRQEITEAADNVKAKERALEEARQIFHDATD